MSRTPAESGRTEGQVEAEILGRPVRRSRLNIDPESGTGVILLTLASERCSD